MGLDITNFLDLYNLFVNELFGSIGLFITGGIIIIAFIGLYSKMPYEVLFMSIGLFLINIFAYSKVPEIWAFLLLGVGISFYFAIDKIINR